MSDSLKPCPLCGTLGNLPRTDDSDGFSCHPGDLDNMCVSLDRISVELAKKFSYPPGYVLKIQRAEWKRINTELSHLSGFGRCTDLRGQLEQMMLVGIPIECTSGEPCLVFKSLQERGYCDD